MMQSAMRESGFTLVEILVGVLILGILVVIGIPVFSGATYDARQKTCFANQRTLEGSAQQWAAAGTVADPHEISDLDDIVTLVSTGFIGEIPSCPSGGPYSMTGGLVAACTEPTEAPHGHY